MDGLSLYAMMQEISPLIGARVDKVQQPDADSILLTFRKHRLLINIHNANGRVQLTNAAFENPANAPSFCMLLRKHLINSKLVKAFSVDLDRIAILVFHGKNELFDEVELRLIVELMGRHGNLFLVDSNGKILDCMRHFGLDESSIRFCMPNAPYISPPAQDRPNPLTANLADYLPCDLSKTFMGISKQLARVLPNDARELSELFARLREGLYSPALYDFGAAPFLLEGGTPCPTLSDAMDKFFMRRDIELRMQRQSSSLRTVASHALSRCNHRLSDAFAALQGEEELHRLRICGELLTANMHALRKGQARVVLENYYENPPSPLEISLDPTLSPSENAKRYFKKYRKAKAAIEYAKKQMDGFLTEQKTLESILQSIQTCTASSELQEIAAELIELGYIKKAQNRPVKVAPTAPMKFVSRNGTAIEVGKNNKQNDALTKGALPDEFWFHAKDIPASHVILHSAEPTETDIEDAAMLAATFSKANQAGKVPVDYTRRRFVKRPSGAPLGFVIYTNQRTVYAEPNDKKAREMQR